MQKFCGVGEGKNKKGCERRRVEKRERERERQGDLLLVDQRTGTQQRNGQKQGKMK